MKAVLIRAVGAGGRGGQRCRAVPRDDPGARGADQPDRPRGLAPMSSRPATPSCPTSPAARPSAVWPTAGMRSPWREIIPTRRFRRPAVAATPPGCRRPPWAGSSRWPPTWRSGSPAGPWPPARLPGRNGEASRHPPHTLTVGQERQRLGLAVAPDDLARPVQQVAPARVEAHAEDVGNTSDAQHQ